MGTTHQNLKDAELIKAIALPATAGSVVTEAIDLGEAGAKDQFRADAEFEIVLPALGATPLPNGETMIAKVQTDDDSAFGSPTDIIPAALTLTGAGGVGDAEDTYRFRVPAGVERYIRIHVTGSTTIGDCSGSDATLQMVF